MKKKFLSIVIAVIILITAFSVTLAIENNSNAHTIKLLGNEITQISNRGSITLEEKDSLEMKAKTISELINKEQQNRSKLEKTESQKQVEKLLDNIYNESIKKFEIDTTLYDKVEFSDINTYLCKIENIELKNEISQKFESVYFYEDIRVGDSKPFILFKKDFSEIIIGYKDIDDNYIIRKVEKDKSKWVEKVEKLK